MNTVKKLTVREPMYKDHTLVRENLDLIEERKIGTTLVQIARHNLLGMCYFFDDYLQAAEIDNAISCEIFIHPCMMAHPCPKNVLVVGDALFTAAREVLRHNTVEKVYVVEIDGDLVEFFKDKMDSTKNIDSRVTVVIDDVANFVREREQDSSAHEGVLFDVIIFDVTDPEEDCVLSRQLYTKEFLQRVKTTLLAKKGVFGTYATDLHLVQHETAIRIMKTTAEVFGRAELLSSFIASYNYELGFCVCSPEKVSTLPNITQKIEDRGLEQKRPLEWYSEDIHRSLFVFGKKMQNIIDNNTFPPITENNMAKYNPR